MFVRSSSLIKIFVAFPDAFDLVDFLKKILPGLPVVNDYSEIVSVLEFLMKCYPAIHQNSDANLSHQILENIILTKVSYQFASASLEPEFVVKVINFIRQYLPSAPTKDTILSNLKPEQISRI